MSDILVFELFLHSQQESWTREFPKDTLAYIGLSVKSIHLERESKRLPLYASYILCCYWRMQKIRFGQKYKNVIKHIIWWSMTSLCTVPKDIRTVQNEIISLIHDTSVGEWPPSKSLVLAWCSFCNFDLLVFQMFQMCFYFVLCFFLVS